MQLHLEIPGATNSWKPDVSVRALDYRTPSPPLHAIHPVSPVEAASHQEVLNERQKPKKRRAEDTSEAPRKRSTPKTKNGHNRVADQSRASCETTQLPSAMNGQLQPQPSSSALDLFAAVATSPSLRDVSISHEKLRHSSEQGLDWTSTFINGTHDAAVDYEASKPTTQPSRRSYSETAQMSPDDFVRQRSSAMEQLANGSNHSPRKSVAHPNPPSDRQDIKYSGQLHYRQDPNMLDAELLLGFTFGSAATAFKHIYSPPQQASLLSYSQVTETSPSQEPIAMSTCTQEPVTTEDITTNDVKRNLDNSQRGMPDTNRTLQEISLCEDPNSTLSPHESVSEYAQVQTAVAETPSDGITRDLLPELDVVQDQAPPEEASLMVDEPDISKSTSVVPPEETLNTVGAEMPFEKSSNVEEHAASVINAEADPVTLDTNLPESASVDQVDQELVAVEHIPEIVLPEAIEETTTLGEPGQKNTSAPIMDESTLEDPPLVEKPEITENVINLQDNLQPLAEVHQLVIEPSELLKVDVCTICNQNQHSSSNHHDLWIACTGCKTWSHGACAGFDTERKVKEVDKFYCKACEPRFGTTTFVRKSARAHASVDYAGLNEGKIRTSVDVPDHHYITPIKEGKIQFQPECFPRMRPELITAAYFERLSAMTEPIVIPAWMNPRPSVPGGDQGTPMRKDLELSDDQTEWFSTDFEYDCVPDDGQDKLDMVIPQGLTVPRVAELYGPDERVEVIDVKSQEGVDKRWTMRQWADYYEKEGEKPIHNVISLEVSDSKLGRLIRRPKVVRDLDLQDAVWPKEEVAKGNFPKVQFYCLMSVADCYTDFHIDFGGSSVYYHILKGKKTFFFIPPKPKYLKQYEAWCLSNHQSSTWLGNETKECYRVDLSEGDTMLIPSGWIHAVWTPEKSLVIGGNFLTRMHYGMQIQINEIEKATNVARKFRYPHFQKVLWHAVLQYLQQDPIPSTVVKTLCGGDVFVRRHPIYYEFEVHEDDHKNESELYNARFYSQGEVDGLKDLLQYVLRTAMISLGKVQGVTKSTQDAVVKSIPKGFGEPLDLVKTFAMWTAWKRGNEVLPSWAYPDSVLGDSTIAGSEKKLSVSALKRKERQAAHEAFLVGTDRRSSRHSAKATNDKESTPVAKAETEPFVSYQFEADEEQGRPTALGSKRLACYACRKRRVRCKHREDGELISEDLPIFGIKQTSVAKVESLISTSPPLILSPVFVPKDEGNLIITPVVKPQSVPTLAAVIINNDMSNMTTPTFLQSRSMEEQSTHSQFLSPLSLADDSPSAVSKKSRTKACVECRKSKRRCVHDEQGRIDPIKAQEHPVARGHSISKRSRTDSDGVKGIKKLKATDSADTPTETTEMMNIAPSADTNKVESTIAATHAPAYEPAMRLYDPAYPPYEGSPDPLHGYLNSITLVHEWATPLNHEPLSHSSGHGNIEPLGLGHGIVGSNSIDPRLEDGIVGSDSIDPRLEDGNCAVVGGSERGSEKVANATQLVGDSTDVKLGRAAENISRTPSLHIHTNGTESTMESKSNQSSPLTELPTSPLEQSFPLLDNESDNTIILETSHPIRHPVRQRKTVERFSETIFEANHEERKSASRVPSLPASIDKALNRETPRPGPRTPQGPSAECSRRSYTTSPSTKHFAASRRPSATEEAEDKSIRLVRELTGSEFGLRRRSK